MDELPARASEALVEATPAAALSEYKLQLTTYSLQLTTHNSQLTAYSLQLTTYKATLAAALTEYDRDALVSVGGCPPFRVPKEELCVWGDGSTIRADEARAAKPARGEQPRGKPKRRRRR